MKTPIAERVCRSIVSRNVSAVMLMLSVLMTVASSQALAQEEALRPPTTDDPPGGPKFLVMFIALLMTGLVVFVATLKSKRGHQD